ncbi:HesA/MoeB/ThiF family protein [Gammaproteobacteria bacterium AB-CW1]|uniref:Molybdopterin-synthase adenylyltransferase n=1 Tax=Natronospira elongata TaxID=3110268 RepID=A0AAP6JEG8_9GAMM|nr:HesA/MoeB/ThiF family protein [Gammaproteobacteria bacterium AB-CW1]
MDRLRYARHLSLPEFGEDAQSELGRSTALIVGMGGLSNPSAAYLAAAGIGRLILADFDSVDTANLQRQILFDSTQVGHDKAQAARDRLLALNPAVAIDCERERLDDANLDRLLPEVDVILDGSDNFPTRFAVNRAAVRHGRPLVSGAAIRWQGQVAVFDSRHGGCYACLFDEAAADDDMGDCASNGVLGPLVGVIGAMQAVEAIKLLTGRGEALQDRLLRYDAHSGRWRETRFARDPLCPVCGRRN